MNSDELPYLSDEIDRGEFLGEGDEGKVFDVENREGEVVKILNEDAYHDAHTVVEELSQYKNREKRIPEETNIARTRQAGYFDDGEYNDAPAACLTRVPGREAHRDPESLVYTGYERWSEMNEVLADAPQKHYDKLVEDIRTLAAHSMRIDPSSNNILYDEKEGFAIVDLDLMDEGGWQPELMGILTGIGMTNCFDKNNLVKEDFDNMRRMMTKIERAGNPGSRETEDTTRRMIDNVEREVLSNQSGGRGQGGSMSGHSSMRF